MKWLENNPLGLALAATCGVLLMASATLAYIWSLPPTSGAETGPGQDELTDNAARLVSDMGALADYREVTERPVFDESRRPTVPVDGADLEDGSDTSVAIAGSPEVRLTAVVITPDSRMAVLKPISNGESVIAHEGVPLEGEYSGWIVSDIKPRHIVLASLRGESMELDLQVNTRKIAEPPKPAPQTVEAAEQVAEADEDAGTAPLSRAEEIRQRIAERREELRRQAEEQGGMDRGDGNRADERKSEYQNAIRNMIGRKPSADEKNEENGGDGSGG